MSKLPGYVILGRGRWAQRMGGILSGEGRAVRFVEETRQRKNEGREEYRSRLFTEMKAGGAQVAWLCVAPGEHVAMMFEAALDAGLHVVSEQPWLMTAEETSRWEARAKSQGCVAGVHYEYCLLDELENWRREYGGGAGLRFGGVFHHSRSGHLGLPAMDALGTHLLAMREYAVPDSAVEQIDCGYELADARRVWLKDGARTVAMVDFLESAEPLIQRYVGRLEAAMESGEFTFDLKFAAGVGEEAARLRQAIEAGG
jgi:GFO/IDH/MocA oxidoreductase family protein